MTQPPSSIPGSQRTLAAIVFTDVVGFSARMQREEMHTLGLLQRDFANMRRLCSEHEGAVLKTTGDGLLMRFTSAVQAVACALAMQQHFATQAKEISAKDTLQHRIGIHLGDVLVQDQDVMGDGVNIASRLQAEAEPGGICISQTVYDVVKNKLELRVVSLGERELKNISAAMPVYRLLLEAQEFGSRSPIPPSAHTPVKQPVAACSRALLYAGVALAAIVIAFLVVRKTRSRQPAAPPVAYAPTTAATEATPANVPPAEPEKSGGEKSRDGEGNRKRPEMLQQLQARFEPQLKSYDFDGLAREVREQRNELNAPVATQMLLRSAEQMSVTKEWMIAALQNHTRQRPLRVRDLSGDPRRDARAYVGPDKRLHVQDASGARVRAWTDLPPATLGNMIVSALREAEAAPPREVVQGAMAFARIYSLPDMQEALAASRPRREKSGAK